MFEAAAVVGHRFKQHSVVLNGLDNRHYFYGHMSANTDPALRIIEILARFGARWEPEEPRKWRHLRRSLTCQPAYRTLEYLHRIIKAGAIEQSIFRELMRTPRMKELLKQTGADVSDIRKHAGYTDSIVPKKTPKHGR